jgi:nitrilase
MSPVTIHDLLTDEEIVKLRKAARDGPRDLAMVVKDLHHIASRHYAFKVQCFVLAAGCSITKGEAIDGFNSQELPDRKAAELLEAISGGDTTFILKGGSVVIAPDATYIKEPVYNPCILYASVDLDCITEGHLVLDTAGHYSRPDAFHLTVNTSPQHNITLASDQEKNTTTDSNCQ